MTDGHSGRPDGDRGGQPSSPKLTGLHAVTRSYPADASTAGETRWADVIPLDGGRSALSMGTVDAGGEPTRAIADELRATGRGCADGGFLAAAAMSALDKVLAEAGARAAAVYAIHDSATRSLELASAGPCPPALVAPCGSTTLLASAPLLGTRAGAYEPMSIPFPVGSSLVLYLHTVGCAGGTPRADRLAAQVNQARLFTRGANSVARIGTALVAALGCGQPSHETTVVIVQARDEGDIDHPSQWFPGEARSAGAARGFTLRTMDEWSLSDKANRAAVIVGELSANAIRHSAMPFEVRLHRAPEAIVLEVTDHSHDLPTRTAAGPFDSGHRGLTIVETLADRWGTRAVEDGKVVWAELRLEPRPNDGVLDPS